MPQLDFFTYQNISVLTFVTVFCILIPAHLYFSPRVAQLLKVRARLDKK